MPPPSPGPRPGCAACKTCAPSEHTRNCLHMGFSLTVPSQCGLSPVDSGHVGNSRAVGYECCDNGNAHVVWPRAIVMTTHKSGSALQDEGGTQGVWGESMRKSTAQRQRKGLLLRLRPWVKSIQEVEGRHGAQHGRACMNCALAHRSS